jgi:hypothetical protein
MGDVDPGWQATWLTHSLLSSSPKIITAARLSSGSLRVACRTLGIRPRNNRQATPSCVPSAGHLIPPFATARRSMSSVEPLAVTQPA